MDNLEYRVGRFTLKPFRQLLDVGLPVPIGRKALDLISVLAKAEGALVTKDELMAAVWPKTIVEDNAIQVHIAALRKALGKDAELLSTVHGLGYRLAAARIAALADIKPDEAVKAPWRLDVLMALLAASVIVLAGIGWWLMRDRPAPAPKSGEMKVAVLPFETAGGTEVHVFSDSLQDETVSELSDNQIQVVSRSESAALRGPDSRAAIARLGVGLLLDGTITSDGKNLDVRVHLDDTGEHVTIWSAEFQGPAGAALAANAATGAADAIFWGKVGRTGKTKLDATGLAAFIAGRQSTTNVRDSAPAAAESDYRKVVEAAPDFSWGHSGIASAEAFQVELEPNNEMLRADARREAKRALELDPHNGEAYTSLEMVLPPQQWAEREKLLLEGAAADPGFEPGAMMEGRLLWNMGRGRESLAWLNRGHDLNPLHNGESYSLAIALASEGLPVASRALLAGMQEHWPDQRSTRDARFWVNLINGAPDEVLAVLADPKARPETMDQTAADACRVALQAVISNNRSGKVDAARTVLAAADAGSVPHGFAMVLLAMLGDLDNAFVQAQIYTPAPSSYPPAYLFLPQTAAMRTDPRFMPLARKLGLVVYWRSTGQWPDFCSAPGLPYDCRSEAKLAD
jgi:DNA-binding winged helix-turn-helix (wHTH) protein/TolB-like protein